MTAHAEILAIAQFYNVSMMDARKMMETRESEDDYADAIEAFLDNQE